MPHASNPTDGVRITYDDLGEGPPLVLVHGSATMRALWHAFGFVELLAPGRRLILLDVRGHGESDKPQDADDYAMERLTEDVRAVLDAAGVERADYFGYSLGGRIGFALAASSPERIRSLVLGGASHRPQEGALERLIYPGFTEVLADRGIDGFLEEWARRIDMELPPQIRAIFARADPGALIAFARRTDREPGVGEEVLAGFDMPVLLFAGEHDEERLADTRAAAAALPRAETFTVEGGDHVTTLARADVIAPRVAAFLAG